MADTPTPRDLWLHRYLTTSHTARLHFGHAKLAQRRLRHLTALRLVDRFWPPAARQAGFGAWWYRLASKGAHHLAEIQDRSPKDLLPPGPKHPNRQRQAAEPSIRAQPPSSCV